MHVNNVKLKLISKTNSLGVGISYVVTLEIMVRLGKEQSTLSF